MIEPMDYNRDSINLVQWLNTALRIAFMALCTFALLYAVNGVQERLNSIESRLNAIEETQAAFVASFEIASDLAGARE